MIGRRRPSSKTSRASPERTRPPTSAAWQVFANQPATRPPWKTGVATVKSFTWPLVCHGSFVTRTSPGSSRSSG